MSVGQPTISDSTLITVCNALRNQQVVEFVHDSVKAGYDENFVNHREEVARLVDDAFAELSDSQRTGISPIHLADVTSRLMQRPFSRSDSSHWFHAAYHQYKTKFKPEIDLQSVRGLISGERVLDYGTGSGYFAAGLAREGYEVLTTDVLDYRYEEATALPFVRMDSASELPFPPDAADTAVVQAVLHHIAPEDLPRVIQGLRRVAKHLLIKEDTYRLTEDLPGYAERVAAQPLLERFVRLSFATQWQVLVLIDYFGNAIAQGVPEMNMPFAFKTVPEWRTVLESNGFRVGRVLLNGFQAGLMHKSCHVWLVCERGA
jgi:SAM-dependent methyltransferase